MLDLVIKSLHSLTIMSSIPLKTYNTGKKTWVIITQAMYKAW